ncbi:MAG: TIGR03936 family radical SAM-associated protein [Clostridia bacterium]|nr:TIGR03936 family radical SAM-associated protein [Clostridia bacterium]
MNRYVLRFTKKGNMRFISHLDLARLFKRAVRKGGINVGFSNGYNPHELVNIVQPLSLGYESESEYYEIDTIDPYDPQKLSATLNEAMPEGLKFFDSVQTERTSDNLSNKTSCALYEAVFGLKSDACMPDLTQFLDQERIFITKKDKKTKKPVEKDIKAFINELSADVREDGAVALSMMLRCASNETLNPGKLLQSMFKYYNLDVNIEDCRVTRIDLFSEDAQGRLVPLHETLRVL